jgi:predicted AlkP superfamily pyrophosphatase or phosphodiesterase
MTGHKYGIESKETDEVLATIDEYIGKVVSALEDKVGGNNFVIVLTADHGMVPSPDITGGKRIYAKDFLGGLQKAFDHNGNDRKVFVGYSGYNIYIDKEELAKNGYSLNDVKGYLMRDDSILVAFTENEVIANISNVK